MWKITAGEKTGGDNPHVSQSAYSGLNCCINYQDMVCPGEGREYLPAINKLRRKL